VVIKTTKSQVFGGFTTAHWESNWRQKKDNNAFIFADTNIYPVTEPKYAIVNNSSFGPIFGNGNNICVYDNSNTNNSSYINPGYSYSLPADANGHSAILSGEHYFLSSEIEVYLITPL
jgi:TLD